MIKPNHHKVFLKLDEMHAGVLDVSNQNILSEQGTVTHIGVGVEDYGVKVGDKVCVKVWGLDHIDIDGVSYYVCDIDSKAILCTIQNES